MKLLIQ